MDPETHKFRILFAVWLAFVGGAWLAANTPPVAYVVLNAVILTVTGALFLGFLGAIFKESQETGEALNALLIAVSKQEDEDGQD